MCDIIHINRFHMHEKFSNTGHEPSGRSGVARDSWQSAQIDTDNSGRGLCVCVEDKILIEA